MPQDIINSLGLQNISSEEQVDILQTLEEQIHEKILSESMDKLDESQKAELDQLIETSSPEEVLAFLEQHIPDFENLIKAISTQTVEEFKSQRT
jgi:hypothetical protein